jgi:LysR family transcriptional regulator, chromosome initiation inhibitor
MPAHDASSGLPRLNPAHLHALSAVARLGGFERAAAALGLSQSAVSQRIAALERQIGRAVLQRTLPPRPTAAGRALLRHAQAVAALEGDLADLLGGSTDGAPATLGIAVNADSLATWFMPVLQRAVAATGALVALEVDDQSRTHEALREGRVAGCVTSLATPLRGCTVQPLGAMAYTAVASAALWRAAQAAGRAPRPGQAPGDWLVHWPLVAFNTADRLQDEFLSGLGAPPATALQRHLVPSSESYAQAIALGFGWGLLPQAQCAGGLARGDLVALVPGRNVALPLHWQQPAVAPALHRRFADLLVAGAREALGAAGYTAPASGDQA